MTLTIESPAVPLGKPTASLDYPISVDYVKSWTLVRALAEAVANAIDADPHDFQVFYDTRAQELVIEDFAVNGVGMESMVFGWSDKTGRDDTIGQFGEGLKIATIRSVSDPQVRHFVIESVGVTIIPRAVEHKAAVNGLAIPVKSGPGSAPKVLRWDLYPSERSLGTRVRVGVPRNVAEEVMGRFRQISDPGYEPPTGTGTVVRDQPGSVWIGGVLVKEVRGLTYGYDLSLASAKRFQNRDRTVVENSTLSWAIQAIQNETNDPALLSGWVRKALDGTLIDLERGVVRRRLSTADERRTWEEVAWDALDADPATFYYRKDRYDAETALSLDDENMTEIVPNGLNQWEFTSLMGLLGVKPATERRREKPQQPVRWAKRLTVAESAALDASVATLRRIFGENAVAKVRVYEEVLDASVVGGCTWLGFYTPRTGDIALARIVLADRTVLDETLFHEVGHRLAHQGLLGARTGDFSDRSRGFEEVLGRMAVRMMQHLADSDALNTIAAPAKARPALPSGPESFPAGRRLAYIGKEPYWPKHESVLGPRLRTLALAALVRWGRENGVPEKSLFVVYADKHYVTVSRVRQLLLGPISSQIDYQHFVDVLGPLGVDPAVAWWTTTGVMSQWSNRRPTTKERAFTRSAAQSAGRACADLIGGPYAEFADALRNIAKGRAAVRAEWDDERWMAPVVRLLDAAEHNAPETPEQDAALVARLANVPGGLTYQEAWDAYLDAKEGGNA